MELLIHLYFVVFLSHMNDKAIGRYNMLDNEKRIRKNTPILIEYPIALLNITLWSG